MKNREIFKILDNDNFLIPSFIYSYKQDKVLRQNLALAKLFSYDSVKNLNNRIHDKIYNILGAKGVNKVLAQKEKGITFYEFNFSFFTNKNEKRNVIALCNQINDDLLIVFLNDKTLEIEKNNKIETSYLENTLNKDAIIRALLSQFETVIKIDIDNFNAKILDLDGEEYLEKEIETPWTDYINFLLSLIKANDSKRLSKLVSKENLKEFSESKNDYLIENFESEFALTNALRQFNTLKYQLILKKIKSNDKTYVFLMFKLLDNIDKEQNDFNLLNLVSSNYFTILKLDNKLNVLKVVKANKEFEEYAFLNIDNKNYNEALMLYSNRFVSKLDKERFNFETSLENVNLKLKETNSYKVSFRRIYNLKSENVDFIYFKTIKDNKEEISIAIKTNSNINSNELSIDSMTDLYNFTGFVRTISEKLNQNQKGYIIYLRLVNLKEYNKLFGHLAGDKILLKIGNIVHRLENEYVIIGSHMSQDEFVLYVDLEKDKLIDFVEYLIERVQLTSKYFDFLINTGICDVRDEILDVNMMVLDAKFACENKKDIINQNFYLYEPKMKDEIEFERDEMNFIINSIKENKLISYFRAIYKNGKIIGYDYNIRTYELFRNHNRSLYPFLEKNRLSFNVNMNSVNEIIEKCKACDKIFIIYLTRQVLENKKEMISLVNRITSDNLSRKVIISIGANNIEYTINDLMINYFKENNISYMFDYSNSISFNISSLIKFKPNFIKLDTKSFKDLGKEGLDILKNILNIVYSNNIGIYLANLSEELFDYKIEDSYYTIKGDKIINLKDI